MKIEKFNENFDVKKISKKKLLKIEKAEDFFNEKYNKDINEYILYNQKLNNPGYNFPYCASVLKGTLEECLTEYNNLVDSTVYENDYLFIVEKHEKSRYISEKELKMLLDSNKFNI
jgi:hypothetical protein